MAQRAVDRWREAVRAASDVEALLESESRLPGPRGNIELALAYAEEADAEQARRLVVAHTPQVDAVNTPGEFLAFCGVIAHWRLALAGEAGALDLLRSAASDPRWRVREGVAMALQRLGDDDPGRLVEVCRAWAGGARFEQRAAVAALCEPRLLVDAPVVAAAHDVLDATTASLVAAADRRSDGFVALRKALGYGWSVVAVADWARVRPALERWQQVADPDVQWVMRQNLRKRRLLRLDRSWVDAAVARSSS